ncbi:hypothetical protein, partial [Stenotrophomonas maltophilia group sp. Smal12]|uniref:hypothetical protein n=1 Tax=Stenotrophomonas maltophilia group sp. Smal12 TaxID=3050414 RepID=UPI00300E74CA
DHLLHRLCPELIRVLLAVAHKHLGHCHQLWQPDVYERLAGPLQERIRLKLKGLSPVKYREQAQAAA